MTMDGITTNDDSQAWAVRPPRTREECAKLLLDLRSAYRSLSSVGRDAVKASLGRAIEIQTACRN
jgi:aminoglycoside phosphotransferase (APT) family kinase protein